MPRSDSADPAPRPTRVRPAAPFRTAVLAALAAWPLGAGCGPATPEPQNPNPPDPAADAGPADPGPMTPDYAVEMPGPSPELEMVGAYGAPPPANLPPPGTGPENVDYYGAPTP